MVYHGFDPLFLAVAVPPGFRPAYCREARPLEWVVHTNRREAVKRAGEKVRPPLHGRKGILPGDVPEIGRRQLRRHFEKGRRLFHFAGRVRRECCEVEKSAPYHGDVARRAVAEVGEVEVGEVGEVRVLKLPACF